MENHSFWAPINWVKFNKDTEDETDLQPKSKFHGILDTILSEFLKEPNISMLTVKLFVLIAFLHSPDKVTLHQKHREASD